MVSPMNREAVIAEEQRIMDLYAPHYRATTLTNSYPYQLERQRFADWIVSVVGERGTDFGTLCGLDVGCGTGDILQHLSDRGCKRLTGLDVSPGMIREAARHVPEAVLINQPIDEFGFGEERFSLITAAFTIHHLHEPREFFDLVNRVLLPGGWFFLLEYNRASWLDRKLLRAGLAALLLPLRTAIKVKNKKWLSQLDQVPRLFNSAHRLLTIAELDELMPNSEAYDLQRVTHGFSLPIFREALSAHSAFDRSVARALEAIDKRILPADAGHFQWVAGQRKAI